ncbi:MAG: hypothetical protein COZ93_05010 [Nitrospirae bacterium CG_4_8_14_3_um_filter_44_28]|nr:MAG: hypothetical protein COZ93_05010 [Nitrospirae bacterium CG_4_8_14_3_um_filter_44_28]
MIQNTPYLPLDLIGESRRRPPIKSGELYKNRIIFNFFTNEPNVFLVAGSNIALNAIIRLLYDNFCQEFYRKASNFMVPIDFA